MRMRALIVVKKIQGQAFVIVFHVKICSYFCVIRLLFFTCRDLALIQYHSYLFYWHVNSVNKDKLD